MSAEAWARSYVSPPSFTACGHVRIERQHYPDGAPNGVACLDCPAFWYEHTEDLPDEIYDTLLAYVAFRLDSNK